VGAVATGVVVADFDDLGVLNPLTRRETAEGGEASMRFLESAVSDLKRGMLDAVVTGPIHKTSWRLAGYKFPGHTEYLADRFRTKRITMAFVADKLRVALATTHIPLLELRNKFTIGTVFQPIELLNDALRDWFGVEHPRIAVAGLNPHASENGQFGDEEERIIIPAIEMAKLAGVDASGPYPADTLFCEHKRHTYDGVVAMYHDQGLIPVKLLAFDSSVNVTLGLPCIRTSVDHGTAFDIVGNNSANAGSMTAAIRLAIQLAEVKNKRLPSQTNGAPRS
jgi:4-hydroxythreonine-4-phosphate dehydrogenase